MSFEVTIATPAKRENWNSPFIALNYIDFSNAGIIFLKILFLYANTH